MEKQPYSIYVDKRHIKIAFLLNKRNRNINRIFDNIFDYNIFKWGGRFNPIILTDNKNISEKAWDFLLNYDPDFIQTFSDLNKKTVEKIDNFLSPIFVKKESKNISLNIDPVSIAPTFRNLKKISLSFDNNFKLAVFDFDRKTPDYIIKFIKYNFGLIPKDSSFLKRNIGAGNKKIYKIKTLKDLGVFLDESGEFRSDIVFPIQLCSINATFKDPEYNSDYEKFEVITGDKIDNLIYYWNRNFFVKDWLRTRITSLWLPTKIAENKELSGSLSKFIKRYANLTGNDNQRGVRFVSFDLSSNSLKSLKKKLCSQIYLPTFEIEFKDFQTPNYKDYNFYHFNSAKMDLYKGRSNQEEIVLSEPDIEQGVMAGQHWFADIRIQFRPERFTHIIGKDFWWKLPNRNILAHQMIGNKPSRINRSGYFSVLMKRSCSSIFVENQNENLLEIKILEDEDIIRLLCFQKFSPIFNRDLRSIKKITQYTNLNVSISSNGKNLNGLIGLFDGLSNAHNIFSKRYWRRMFDEISKKEKILNDQQIQIVENKLKKTGGAKKATEYLSNLLEGILNNERFFPYNYFKKEARKELNDFNKKGKTGEKGFKFNEGDFKRAIQYLIEQEVLIMGISPHCPICGTKNWFSVDEIKKDLKCAGCNNIFHLKTEERWFYRLNSLVKNCHVFQGLVPVVITLGELLDRCNACFIYTVSLDIYKKRKKKPITDLDVVCIRDGKFIIGEIKQSSKGFQDKDFEAMKYVAKKIKPDVVLFSSMDIKPKKRVLSKIENLKRELKELGIKVIWHEIDRYDLEPDPYFL